MHSGLHQGVRYPPACPPACAGNSGVPTGRYTWVLNAGLNNIMHKLKKDLAFSYIILNWNIFHLHWKHKAWRFLVWCSLTDIAQAVKRAPSVPGCGDPGSSPVSATTGCADRGGSRSHSGYSEERDRAGRLSLRSLRLHEFLQNFI